MKILAVEFSSEDRSVAVLDDRNGTVVVSRVCERGGRRALELVEAALSKAGCAREEIGCLAVGVGPGSYAGIRGAIALAQGWQLGRGIKLLAIGSAECLAAQAREDKLFGPVHVVIDAQRNEFYLATYEITSGAAIPAIERAETEKKLLRTGVFLEGAALSAPRADYRSCGRFLEGFREIVPLHLVPMEEVRRLCVAGEKVMGPDAGEVFPLARSVSPDAATLARLACGRSDFLPGNKLEPIYLRLTDFKKAPPRRIIQ